MSRSITLIVNAKAGASKPLRAAVTDLRKEGNDVEVRATWESGHGTHFAAEATRDGRDVVFACGGDGTVNEVANGILDGGGSATLGILPFGTANDFATAAGLPTKDEPREALEKILAMPARRIDVGRVNDRAFVNVTTMGFGTYVTATTPVEVKRAVGGFAYLLNGLVQIVQSEPVGLAVSAEGLEWEGPVLALAVGNGSQAGGGAQLAPHARIDDGLLDLTVLPQVGASEINLLAQDVVRSRESLDGPFERLILGRGTAVTVRSKDETQANADGEAVLGTEFRYTVEPGALDCLLPPDCPLCA